MRYICDNVDDVRNLQTQMIQKAYPSYDDGQYVLWCVFDFYYKHYTSSVQADMQVFDSENQIIAQHEFDTNKICVRRPYVNKNISQIGLKAGRKRVFGVPMVFDSFVDISKVHKIRVVWTAYEPIWFTNRSSNPFSMNVDQVIIEYDVTFEKHPQNHYYTIRSYDGVYDDVYALNCNMILEHLQEYDSVVSIYGDYDINDNNNQYNDFEYCCCVPAIEDNGIIPRREVQLLDELTNLPWNVLEIQDQLSKENVLVETEVSFSRGYYKKSIHLSADAYADIVL